MIQIQRCLNDQYYKDKMCWSNIWPKFNTRKKDYHKVAERKWEKWLARIKGRDSNEEDMDISSIKVTFPHLAYMIKLEKELKRLN
jgi:hypothetical protein